MKGNWGGGLVRRTCKQSTPARGVWGHAPSCCKCIFWSDSGTYELRVLTSAHMHTKF